MNNNYLDTSKTFTCLTCGKTNYWRRYKKNMYCSSGCNPICMKGRVFREETKKLMSEKSKGRHNGIATEFKKGQRTSPETEFKKGQTALNKGKKIWVGEKQLNLIAHPFPTGNLHPNWKGGITPINQKIRSSQVYKAWRKAVFERDDYTCKKCGEKGGYLHADHIKPFSMFIEERFNIDNGRTLCRPCHRKTDTYGRKIYNLYNGDSSL